MNERSLRKRLIRLAYEKPELRAEILPLITPSRDRDGSAKTAVDWDSFPKGTKKVLDPTIRIEESLMDIEDGLRDPVYREDRKVASLFVSLQRSFKAFQEYTGDNFDWRPAVLGRR